MNSKKGIIIMVVCFAVLLVLAGLLYDKLGSSMGEEGVTPAGSQQAESGSQSEAETRPEPAPDFTVYDSEGNPVSLSDLKGKPVVINFWATWCPHCVGEMPDFQKIWEEQGDEVHFMMINQTDGVQETKEKALDFLAEEGFTFPVYYDTELDASVTYGVRGLPATYFIDAEGNGIAYASGAINAEILQQGIDMCMAEE